METPTGAVAEIEAGRVSTEAEEIQRIISARVRDMLDAYRIQAQAGPVTDKALGLTIPPSLLQRADEVIQ